MEVLVNAQLKRSVGLDPVRFIEQDPIGEGGGLNLYAYAGASPTMWVDPSGLIAHGASGPRSITSEASEAFQYEMSRDREGMPRWSESEARKAERYGRTSDENEAGQVSGDPVPASAEASGEVSALPVPEGLRGVIGQEDMLLADQFPAPQLLPSPSPYDPMPLRRDVMSHTIGSDTGAAIPAPSTPDETQSESKRPSPLTAAGLIVAAGGGPEDVAADAVAVTVAGALTLMILADRILPRPAPIEIELEKPRFKRSGCNDCYPAVGVPGYRMHANETIDHYDKATGRTFPVGEIHLHWFVSTQRPDCTCDWHNLGLTTPPPPLPGSVDITVYPRPYMP